MNSITPKMAAAFGMGFIGFILAAYSYNQQHKNEFTPVSSEKNSNNLEENNSENNSENNEENNEEIKEEVSSFIKKIGNKHGNKNVWGQFWKGEYENMRSEKDSNN